MKGLRVIFASAALTVAAMLVGAHAACAQAQRQPPDAAIDAATRTQVIESLLKQLNDRYVFPETATRMEQAVRAHLAQGEYEQLTSAQAFAQKLTADLQAVSHDKHLRVRYSPEPIPTNDLNREPTAEQREQFRQYMARINYGFERVERLPGNIGYLELRGFLAPELAQETVASAFNFLANTDALIIDLRQNGGGDPAMVALVCSYLFGAEPVHLNDLYWRAGNRTQEFWTLKEVPGRRFTGKDVYVLTSNYTFSGAEEFTYNLKNLKRATIVGETTGGGANPGGGVRLAEHFGAFIPTGRAINPITKTNWEGTGVEPDVKVPAAQALQTAHLAALKKQLEKTADPELKDALREQIEKLQKELGGAQSGR